MSDWRRIDLLRFPFVPPRFQSRIQQLCALVFLNNLRNKRVTSEDLIPRSLPCMRRCRRSESGAPTAAGAVMGRPLSFQVDGEWTLPRA
jgi:hypothetical protein